jgi:release factor glutamine methyltransferase
MNSSTITSLIDAIRTKIASLYKDSAEREQIAWWILEHITQKKKLALVTSPAPLLSSDQETALADLLKKHIHDKMPLQYIFGSVPFGDLSIRVEPPLLIPRPETEEWSLKLVDRLKKVQKPLTILDLCTGTGCIALLLARHLPKSPVYALDISQQALILTRRNAQLNNIESVTCVHSDLYDQLPPSLLFDIIVTNPPYISHQEWETLDPMVRNWEDKNALIASDNGINIIQRIIKDAPKRLKHSAEFAQYNLPELCIEIGYQQGKIVSDLMKMAGFAAVEIHQDLAGKDRLVTGRIP